MTVQAITIEDLELRTDLQPRERLDDATVADYVQAMEAGDDFPPVKVVAGDDGEHLWLWDGFHRIEAAKRAGKEKFLAVVETGTLRDAILYSVAANATHGKRRSNDDKRKAVTTLLQDGEWSQWSDREIARLTHTSHPFVSKVRSELSTGNVSRRKYRTPDGETRTMDTAPIAEANQARAEGSDPDGVDDDTLAMICRTSVDYAKHFIHRANYATAKAALKYETQHRNRSSLITLLERRMRVLDNEAGGDGLDQEAVKAGVYAYLHEHYDEDDVASMLVELNDARQWNNFGSIEAHLDGEPAMRNGIIHAVDEVVRELRERPDEGDEPQATMEELRAGVWAYLDDDYETYDLDGRIQALTRMLNARNYVDVEPYVPENHEHSALARATRQAVRALNREKRQSPEFAEVWEIEQSIRKYLNETFVEGDTIGMIGDLEMARDSNSLIAHFTDHLPQIVRHRDVLQAVNNIIEQMNQTRQTATVTYASVDVPETVEDVQVVEPATEARQSEIKVTYLPKAVPAEDPEPEPAPTPRPEDDAGPATIDISLVLDPEAEKFHVEVSERDVPSGTYRGKLENLHKTLDVAILRVWPEARRFFQVTGAAPDPTPQPEPDKPDPSNGLQKGDWVRWGSGPEQCGEIINFTLNGKKVFMRDQSNRIHHYPPHMLTVVQKAEVS